MVRHERHEDSFFSGPTRWLDQKHVSMIGMAAKADKPPANSRHQMTPQSLHLCMISWERCWIMNRVKCVGCILEVYKVATYDVYDDLILYRTPQVEMMPLNLSQNIRGRGDDMGQNRLFSTHTTPSGITPAHLFRYIIRRETNVERNHPTPQEASRSNSIRGNLIERIRTVMMVVVMVMMMSRRMSRTRWHGLWR